MINKEMLEHYGSQGFSEDHDFPGEYLLLVQPQSMRRVRLYYDGRIWEQDVMGVYQVKESEK